MLIFFYMKSYQIRWYAAFTALISLLTASSQVIGQTDPLHTQPPRLKSGKSLGYVTLLGYRSEADSFMVITLRFKLTATGMLDTLHVSDNAPSAFVEKATSQLTNLNGQWIPQKKNGKPVASKWLVSRYYMVGPRVSNDVCNEKMRQNFFDAYYREEELFLCKEKHPQPLKCLIEYVEGFSYYLSPPLLSETVR